MQICQANPPPKKKACSTTVAKRESESILAGSARRKPSSAGRKVRNEQNLEDEGGVIGDAGDGDADGDGGDDAKESAEHLRLNLPEFSVTMATAVFFNFKKQLLSAGRNFAKTLMKPFSQSRLRKLVLKVS